ncbi:uncharacterized protein [Dysidea avara]|uniref:uncharacterized protein isoform X2 n=1 Tax=Dysidea avara TaxID=196820 RepID=UPI0033239ED8
MCICSSYKSNSTIQSLPLFNRSLFTLPQFSYSGNVINGQSFVGNNPTFFSGTSDLKLTINLQHEMFTLCEIFELSVQSFDQSGNKRSGLFQVNSGDTVTCNNQISRIYSVENSGSVYATVCDVDLSAHCDSYSSNYPTNITQTLTYAIIDEITGDLLPEQHLAVNISCCHTGYVYDESQRKCVFDTSHSIFVAESLDRRYVYIKTRFFGQHLEDNQFFSAVVPSSYYKCHIEPGSTIRAGCLFKFDHPYEQCLGNRTGFLCGRCPPPKGLTLNLRECQICNTLNIVIFILVCILIVAISFVIMTFDIGLPNKLRGFLFFAQIVSIVYQRNGKGGIDLDYHLARQLGISLYLPICLSRNMDALSVTLLGLCFPLMMFMTIIIFIFLAQHIRYLGHHQSINGIWLLIFLMYVFTTRTSFDLIRCVPTYDINDNFKEFRFFYDGSIKCFQGKHLFYMFISLLLILTVVIPGPCAVALISYRHFTIIPFRDVATKGIKIQYRWWSAYDFLRRTVFILIVIFEGYLYEYHQLILTFISLVCLIITARLHPYEDSWSNLIESLVLLDLLLIAGYFLNDHSSESVIPEFEDAFAIILLVIPFAYGILYIITSVIRKIWYKYRYRHWQELDDSFIIVPSPEDNEDQEYNGYRDELLAMDSID